MSDRDDLIALFTNDGFTNDGGSPHSWRCEYPDRYGTCGCPGEMADAVLEWAAKRNAETLRRGYKGAANHLEGLAVRVSQTRPDLVGIYDQGAAAIRHHLTISPPSDA